MSAENQIVQKKVVRLQPLMRRKRQFYNMLLEIVPKKMMSRDKFDEYSPDYIQSLVEQEIEKMSDEEGKSCYQVEFGKIVDDECGDEGYNKKPVFKFVAEACGCEFFPEEAEKIEFECDRNNDNAYCPDCYDGEYDEECANCDCLCSSEWEANIEGDDVYICENCFDNMEKCEMCGDPTDEDEWCDIQANVLYCSSCKEKYKVRIAECEAIVHSSSSPEEALAKWESIQLEKAIAKAEAIDKKVEAIREAEVFKCEVPSILEEGEKEVNGVCWECGIEGKFIGEEGDDWRCSECSSI